MGGAVAVQDTHKKTILDYGNSVRRAIDGDPKVQVESVACVFPFKSNEKPSQRRSIEMDEFPKSDAKDDSAATLVDLADYRRVSSENDSVDALIRRKEAALGNSHF